jgi:hypothetical protein
VLRETGLASTVAGFLVDKEKAPASTGLFLTRVTPALPTRMAFWGDGACGARICRTSSWVEGSDRLSRFGSERDHAFGTTQTVISRSLSSLPVITGLRGLHLRKQSNDGQAAS